MKKLHLSTGEYALVDDSDYPILTLFKWSFVNNQNKTAVVSYGISKDYSDIKLHNFLLNPKSGYYVFHKNRNPLDCQRANLAVLNKDQFEATRPPYSTNTSGFKGVSYRKRDKVWVVKIRYQNRNVHIGMYKNIIEAAIAYNKAAVMYHGPYAWQNDMDSISREVYISEKFKPKLQKHHNRYMLSADEAKKLRKDNKIRESVDAKDNIKLELLLDVKKV